MQRIYEDYFTPVFRYLQKLTGDAQLAEELTAETFFKAMKRLDGFRGDCALSVWLCQIAKNTYFSHLRKNRRFTELAEAEVLADGENLEERLLAAELSRAAYEALGHLKEPYQKVFRLRVFGDLSFRALGAEFGKSENWACVTYHRARKKLQKELEETQ